MASDLPPFDPEWLAAEQMMGGRITMPAEPVDQSRARFEAVFKNIIPLLPPPDGSVETTDTTVPSSGQAIRIYRPTQKPISPLPVGLYIHSGGWYSGSIENEDHLCRNVAANAKMILFSAEYRLAPENPYPAGFDDVCAAYRFMYETASSHEGDAKRMFIMGGSAGGNLSAAVGLKFGTDAQLKPSGMCVFVATTCQPSVFPDEYKARYTPELYADSPMIGHEVVAQAREWYAAPAADPHYSVLLHPDIKHLPLCYIAACTKDPTHQETVFFYDECKKQGVDADLVEWVGMPHFFWALPMLNKSHEFMRVWCEKLRKMIADSSSG